MDFTQNVETTLKSKLRNSQVLLGIAILISFIVVAVGLMTGSNYYIWALYFVLIGALTLPNINKSKKDLIDYKKHLLTDTKGKVLDVFAETDNTGKWTIFLEIDENTEPVVFTFPSKPSVDVDTTIKISHTIIFKVPVQIQKI